MALENSLRVHELDEGSRTIHSHNSMQEKVAGAQIDGLQKDAEDFRQLTPFAQSRSFRTEL